MGDIAQRGNRLTFAKGGTVRRPKKPSTQTPRKKKAVGGVIKKVIQGGKKIIDKIKTGKSNKFDTWETIGIPGSPGPKKGKYKHIDTIMESIEKQKKTGKAAGGRIGKDIGGSIKKIAKTAAKRWKKKKVYPETEDLTHQVGPYVGDVGSERPGIKRRGWGKKPGQKKPDREHVPYERHGAKKGGKADKN